MAGLSYSTQRYSGIDPFAVVAINSGSRAMGRVYGFDEWVISRRVSLGYGLSYAWQDYVGGDGLVSPRVSLTVSPVNRLRVRTVIARNRDGARYRRVHPRGQRALVDSGCRRSAPSRRGRNQADLRAQTTDHFEVGVERDLSAYVVGFRTFYQRVDEQAGAMFAQPSLEHPAATPRPLLRRQRRATSRPAGGPSRSAGPIIGSVRGSIDYSTDHGAVAERRRLRHDRPGSAPAAAPTPRPIHDLTTSVETAISQTATRVYVLYKVNSAFARQTPDRPGGPGFDARFDVQVNQALPFMDFTSADWEVLVAVCNLFREVAGERSVYDELLVVRPPKRVVGGVRVRF